MDRWSQRMRRRWERAAASGSDVVIGKPEFARAQLESLFHALEAEPRGVGTCLEIGCGTGRMTVELARRWTNVIGVDVSPTMLARARSRLGSFDNVVLLEVSGTRFDGVPDASVDTVVCFGVLQHQPTRKLIATMFAEIARVLDPGGEAFVQLPVLRRGARARLWRLGRIARGDRAYRGARVDERELTRALDSAGLRPVAQAVADDPTLYSKYPHAEDTRLRLVRGR